MRRDQLEHAIRAACEVSGDDELLVFGSQAILGSHPDAPDSLRASIEVDVQAKNLPDRTDAIDGSLGELSLFHQTHGFYVHGVLIDAATLPEGWQKRTVAVREVVGTRGGTGHCLEAHDLAASKLVANRQKDREFVLTLLAEGLIDERTLLTRVAALPVDSARRESLARWIGAVVEDLG
jgi:hypothetical protein